MSYKNTTYVIFDGDNDIWAYGYMKGWIENEHMEFDFIDAHDIKPLSDRASEETIKARLRERFSTAKQVILLIGKHTKNLHKFVRWELELALELGLPIIAVNLNNKKVFDEDLCPAIIRDEYVVHIPFRAKIIQYALDNFPSEYVRRKASDGGTRHYPASVYTKLGL